MAGSAQSKTLPVISEEPKFYGYLIALGVQCGDPGDGPLTYFYAMFEYGSSSQVFIVPDAKLFKYLSKHLVSMAETRELSDGTDYGYDKLWIEKKNRRWLVYTP